MKSLLSTADSRVDEVSTILLLIIELMKSLLSTADSRLMKYLLSTADSRVNEVFAIYC